EVPTAEVHLGFNCCRNCSVFYKRNREQARALRCKEGDRKCMFRDAKAACRKCRFERFSDVLTKCSESKSVNDIRAEVAESAQRIASEPSLFLDNETCTMDDSSCIETPTLQMMKRAYGLLCLVRKTGEMGTCTAEIYDQYQRGDIKFSLITYSADIPTGRIMYSGLLDFFSSSFDDFRNLSKETQRLIVCNNFDLLNRVDELYRSAHHFPNCDTM
ncbi:hypothetical protein PENTCL1PPCAC_13452, partial [Pristionchus entomophagus]